MNSFTPKALRRVAGLFLLASVAVQPVLASTLQYQVPLKHSKYTPPGGGTGAPGQGTGEGELDPGDQPSGDGGSGGGARLSFVTSRLVFTPEALAAGQQLPTVLRNIGEEPAVLMGVGSTKNFELTSSCPYNLLPGAECEVLAKMRSPVPGTYREGVRVVAVGGAEATLYLQADIPGARPSELLFSPAKLTFDRVMAGVPAMMSSTLTNVGTAAAPITGLTSSKYFHVDTTCDAVLAAGSSCAVMVTYAAIADAQRDIEVPVSAERFEALAVTGTVDRTTVLRKLKVSPAVLEFNLDAPGASQTLTSKLANVGTTSVALSGISSLPKFEVTSDCPAQLGVGATCDISATYSSSGPGGSAEAMQIGVALEGGVALQLSGKLPQPPSGPEAQLTYSPQSLDFGDVSIGAVRTERLSVINTGLKPATGVSFNFLATSSAVTQVNDCPATIQPGQGCSIDVTFAATAPTQYSSMLSGVLDTRAKYNARIQGRGTAAVLSAQKSKSFGTVAVGAVSDARVVSIANVGNLPITGISAPASAGPFRVQSTSCTTSLAPDKGCSFFLQFAPVTSGTVSNQFVVSSENGGAASVLLDGKGTRARLVWAPDTLGFAPTKVGESSATQSLTLSNTGEDDADGLGMSVTTGRASFAQSNNCGPVLRAGSLCEVSVWMVPVNDGELTGTVSALADGVPSVSAGLSGSAYAADAPLTAVLVWSPTAVVFDPVLVGTTSAVTSLTLTNMGMAPTEGFAVGMAAGGSQFQQSNDCGATLEVGRSCKVNVWMAPSKLGEGTGTVAAVTKGAEPARAAVSGFGYENTLTMTPETLSFAAGSTGTTSAAKVVRVTNNSISAATITGIGVATNPAEFGQSNNCGGVVGAGASCNISIAYTPNSSGTGQGTLALQSTMGTYSVALTSPSRLPPGELALPSGTLVKFDPTAVSFASAPRVVTLSNVGKGPLAITSVAITASAEEFVQSNTCGGSIEPGQSCTITLVMTPAAMGERKGTMQISTSSGIVLASLQGEGVRMTGAWTAQSSANFGAVTVGTTAKRGFYFTNTGGAPMPLSVSLAGSGLTFLANNCGSSDSPALLAVGRMCSVLVGYAPSTPSDSLSSAELVANNPQLPQGRVRMGLKGTATTFALAFDATPSADFGLMKSGSVASKVFVLRNPSGAVDTLAHAPTVTGDGFVLKSTTCVAGLSMTSNQTCTMTVQAVAAPASGAQFVDMTGSVYVVSTQGVEAELPLLGQSAEDTGALEFSSGDFGTLPPGSTLTKIISVTNVSPFSVTLADIVKRTGTSTGFSGIPSCAKGQVLAAGKSCTTSMTVGIPSGRDPGTYQLRDQLLAVTTLGRSFALDLTAEYTQKEYTMEWQGNGDYGTLAKGQVVTRPLRLVNTSNSPITLLIGAKRTGVGTGFNGISNSCTAGNVLAPGAGCDVRMQATGLGRAMYDTLPVTNTRNVTATIELRAN